MAKRAKSKRFDTEVASLTCAENYALSVAKNKEQKSMDTEVASLTCAEKYSFSALYQVPNIIITFVGCSARSLDVQHVNSK